MAYRVIYADKPLHNYVNIHSVSRAVLPNRVNSSKSIPNMNGSYYMGYRYGEREIVLNCSLKADSKEDLVESLKELGYILDVKVPQRMVISDAPDKFVWAVIDGTTDIQKVTSAVAKFDLKFVCYDPYEYSLELKNTNFSTVALDDGYYGDEVEEDEGIDLEPDYESEDYFYGEEEVEELGKREINTLTEEEIEILNDSDELRFAKKQTVEFSNNGGVDTYPVFKAQFYDNAHFFQCSDEYGRTVLIGNPPSIDMPNKPPNPVILNDDCRTLEGWDSVGNVLDGDVKRTIDGSLTINKNGYAITCYNYGSSGGDDVVWHGGAGRKNLSKTVENFRVEIDMEHSSGGTLNVISSTPSSGSSGGSSSSSKGEGYYTVTAKTSANVRSGRGTKYKVITTIPKGKKVKITSLSQKWGKVTYNKKTGYISLSVVKWYGKTSSSSSSSSSTKYIAQTTSNIRSGRGTKYSIKGKIAKGKYVYVSSISNGWGYVSYNGVKGYISLKNFKKSTTKSLRADEQQDIETKEDRMGRMEVYLFDKNGVKLGKLLMRDSSSYYEYSEPEIFIGSKLVCSDGLSTPSAKKITVTEDNKKVTKKVDSGSYGEWNSFKGKFILQRTTKNGKQYWTAKVEKHKADGTIGKKLEATNLYSADFPTGELANIVIWFGQHKNDIPVDVQNICNIKVTDTAPTVPDVGNLPIFKNGDELMVDFEEQGVYLNGADFLEQLDIGSEFFTIPSGQSRVTCRTDTDNMNVFAEYRERWL